MGYYPQESRPLKTKLLLRLLQHIEAIYSTTSTESGSWYPIHPVGGNIVVKQIALKPILRFY